MLYSALNIQFGRRSPSLKHESRWTAGHTNAFDTAVGLASTCAVRFFGSRSVPGFPAI